MPATHFKETSAYRKAFSLSMSIFVISKSFPKEEQYALTDQIRRSSRSVCANMAEAFRKRRYPAHFVLKITDSDAENAETSVWLDFALECNYISSEIYKNLISQNIEIGKLLSHMIQNPDKY